MLVHVWWVGGLCWFFFLMGVRLSQAYNWMDVCILAALGLVESVVWPIDIFVRGAIHAVEKEA